LWNPGTGIVDFLTEERWAAVITTPTAGEISIFSRGLFSRLTIRSNVTNAIGTGQAAFQPVFGYKQSATIISAPITIKHMSLTLAGLIGCRSVKERR